MNQLLSLIVNALYTNKDIFLRELISNASDALERIRTLSLQDSYQLENETSLEIRILPNKKISFLCISDTGIGMTKEELINNLGTIAKSGTKAFMEAVQSGHDISMIGQFGVGFYSSFLVADKVVVNSKHNSDHQYVWCSNAGGTFNIYKSSTSSITRGTIVSLTLKEDQREYLEERRLKDLIKRHSEFVMFPIHMLSEKLIESEEKESKLKTINSEIPRKVKNMEHSWSLINNQKPLWMRPPESVTKEEYESLYKALTNDWEAHLAVKHFSVEGQVELKSILFIPRRAPFDMFDQKKSPTNIKVYVRRVFIMDDSKEMVPDYLTFIKGIVDSEDLPLNISRENLQHSKILKVIKKNIVKKSLEMFLELADDKEIYAKFYEAYAKNLKLGIHEDSLNRSKISDLLRFPSSTSSSKLIALKDYVTRMSPRQKEIYYITGESKSSVESSPFIESLRSRGIEVLYLVDPIDEYCVGQLKEYASIKLTCVTKEGLNLKSSLSASEKYLSTKFDSLCTLFKDTLGDKVGKVILSHRLVHSPCVIVTGSYAWSANMERLMKAQALSSNTMGMYMASSKTLELNANNAIIEEIRKRAEEDPNDTTIRDLILLIFDASQLSSGFSLSDPSLFAARIYRMIKLGLSIEDNTVLAASSNVSE